MADIPVVEATVKRVKSKHERWYLTVWACPYCGEEHVHGAGAIVQGHDAPQDSMYNVRQSLYLPGGDYLLTKAKQAA